MVYKAYNVKQILLFFHLFATGAGYIIAHTRCKLFHLDCAGRMDNAHRNISSGNGANPAMVSFSSAYYRFVTRRIDYRQNQTFATEAIWPNPTTALLLLMGSC